MKLCGKRLYPTESVKYLSVKIDANLKKLSRSNTVLFKMREYVSLRTLRSIYFAIFGSYLFLLLSCLCSEL